MLSFESEGAIWLGAPAVSVPVVSAPVVFDVFNIRARINLWAWFQPVKGIILFTCRPVQ